jgi:hypothetical protein
VLITNIHPDSVHFGKVYTEDKLSELLKDAKACDVAFGLDQHTNLLYTGSYWMIAYRTFDTDVRTFPLDPSRYAITSEDAVPKEKIRECYKEIMSMEMERGGSGLESLWTFIPPQIVRSAFRKIIDIE